MIFASSRAKFVASDVFPIPPLFENTEMILHLFFFTGSFISVTSFFIASKNSFFIIGTGTNSFAPALITSIISSTDGLSERAKTLQFLHSLVTCKIKSKFFILFVDKSTISKDLPLLEARILKISE